MMLKKQLLKDLLLAVTAYGRKPFTQIKPSAGLSELAMVRTWDVLASQRK